jgi:hypothetical protein
MTGLLAATYTLQSFQLLRPTHVHADHIAVRGVTCFLTARKAEIVTGVLAEGSVLLYIGR